MASSCVLSIKLRLVAMFTAAVRQERDRFKDDVDFSSRGRRFTATYLT